MREEAAAADRDAAVAAASAKKKVNKRLTQASPPKVLEKGQVSSKLIRQETVTDLANVSASIDAKEVEAPVLWVSYTDQGYGHEYWMNNKTSYEFNHPEGAAKDMKEPADSELKIKVEPER